MAADGRVGHPVAVVVVQVPGDGVGSGVQAGAGETFTQRHDQVDDCGCGGARGGLGSPGAGLEGDRALGLVAGLEFVDQERCTP